MDKNNVVLGISKVFGKGRIQIPSDVRKSLVLVDGDRVYFVQEVSSGRVFMEKAPKPVRGRYE